jgi:hypothetical protein
MQPGQPPPHIMQQLLAQGGPGGPPPGGPPPGGPPPGPGGPPMAGGPPPGGGAPSPVSPGGSGAPMSPDDAMGFLQSLGITETSLPMVAEALMTLMAPGGGPGGPPPGAGGPPPMPM